MSNPGQIDVTASQHELIHDSFTTHGKGGCRPIITVTYFIVILRRKTNGKLQVQLVTQFSVALANALTATSNIPIWSSIILVSVVGDISWVEK